MSYSQKLLEGIAIVPDVVNSIEALFGTHSGQQKKDSALAFVAAVLRVPEASAKREVVDERKFKEGLAKVIDGTVECLNASVWARAK